MILRSTIVNFNVIEEVARDARGRSILHFKARSDVLRVGEPSTHLFRQY